MQETQWTRRRVLQCAAVAGVATLAVRTGFAADDLDPRVAGIVASTMGVDMHNHIPVRFLATGVAEPADDPVVDLAPAAKKSGLSALVYTYPVDALKNPGIGDQYNAHVQAMNQMDRILAKAGMHKALHLADITAAHKQGATAIVQAAEGSQWIEGHTERIAEAYSRGLRHLQLIHFSYDLVKPLGDVQMLGPGPGLTAYGAEVIRECNRQRIVVDLAHAGWGMVKPALAIAKAPLTVTHTALDTPNGRLSMTEGLEKRLVSPEYAKAVADAGGIMGVWHIFPTMKQYAEGIREMVDVVGVDHVGIGTDTSLAGPPRAGTDPAKKPATTNDYFSDQHAGFLYALTDQMLKIGFKPDEIKKIAGGNYCKLFGQVVG